MTTVKEGWHYLTQRSTFTHQDWWAFTFSEQICAAACVPLTSERTHWMIRLVGKHSFFSTWCHHMAHGCNCRICKGEDQAKQSFSLLNSTKNVNAKIEFLKTSKRRGTGFCKINTPLEFINVSAVIWSNKCRLGSSEREKKRMTKVKLSQTWL